MTLTLDQIKFRNDTAIIAMLIIQIILCALIIYQLINIQKVKRDATPKIVIPDSNLPNLMMFLAATTIIVSFFLLFCRFTGAQKSNNIFMQRCGSLFGFTKSSVVFVIGVCIINLIMVLIANRIHKSATQTRAIPDILTPSTSNLFTLSIITLVISILLSAYKLYGTRQHNMYSPGFVSKVGSALWSGAKITAPVVGSGLLGATKAAAYAAPVVASGLWEGTKAVGRGASYLGNLAYDYYSKPNVPTGDLITL